MLGMVDVVVAVMGLLLDGRRQATGASGTVV
jgi:hypothetical protein